MNNTVRFFISITVFFFFNSFCAQEICNNGIDDDGDGKIDCYDTECSCSGYFNEYVADSSCANTAFGNYKLKVVWKGTDKIEDTQTPIVGDIDGDGTPEIIVITQNISNKKTNILVIDGKTGILEKTIPNPVSNTIIVNTLAIADVDNDGLGEIFCVIVTGGSTYEMLCFENNGTLKWQTTPTLYNYGIIGITDFDNDGTIEAYVNNQIFDANTGVLIAQGLSTDSKGRFNSQLGNNTHPTAADVLPDAACPECAGTELICGNEVYGVDIAGKSMTIRSTAPVGLNDGFTGVADLNNDGLLDVAVNMKKKVYVWDPRTGTQIGNIIDFSINNNGGGKNTEGGCPVIGNMDSDQAPEIGIAGGLFYVMIDDGITAEKWRSPTTESGSIDGTGSVAYDFNCDGKLEIVYRDKFYLRIIDGETGIDIDSLPCASGTAVEQPTVVDSDGDGYANIVCACSDNYLGPAYVITYTSSQNNWPTARKVMNQINYFNVNINDDLTVPRGVQNQASVGLNSFNAQSHLMDKNTNTSVCFLSIDPDIKIDTLIYSCDDSVLVKLTICNHKNSPVLAYMPVSLYNGDPTISGTLIKQFNTNAVVAGNSCDTFSVRIKSNEYLLYSYVNDLGTLPASAPEIKYAECDSANNSDQDSVHLYSIKAGFTASPVSGDAPLTVVFTDTSSHTVSYTWDFGDGDTTGTYQMNPDHIYKAAGEYTVEQKVTNVVGCSDSAYYVFIKVNDKTSLYLPGSFTPDGNGVNDVFIPVYAGLDSGWYSFAVYDRWGIKVFDTSDPNKGWDGTYKNIAVQEDIYVCTVTYYDRTREKHNYTGQFTLLK